MKKLILAAMLGSVMLQPSVTPAATQGTDFNVQVNLTSACQITNLQDVVFNYTSFGAAQASAGGTFDIACPATLPYNFTLHVAAGQTGVGGASINNTVLGLNYTLNAPAGGTGSGSHTISGTMAAGQAGTCAAATCTATVQHSLVVEF
jgi:spore coat protein U-like protein